MPEHREMERYTLRGCNWELTLRCSLHCLHCGSRAGSARPGELTLEECLPVADELATLGCREVTMIGGEVFLFRGWELLAGHLASKGVSVNIVTNGYRVGPREVEQIHRAGLVNVGISIDGMEESHNRIRGRDDAFASIQRTLELLRLEKIETGAVTSLMRSNCNDLNALYHFLLDHGVRVWQLQLVSAMGNSAGRHHSAFVLPGQVREITEFIRDMNRNGEMVVIAADSIGYFDDNEVYIRGNAAPLFYWTGCAAGISSVFIDSIGNVKGCGALYDDAFIEGNVRHRSLSAIWHDTEAFAYNRKFSPAMLSGRCSSCTVGHVCRGGCRSSNHFATGTLYESTFCCREQ